MASSIPVLGPIVFLPFHLAGHHLTARAFPYKRITYPLHFIFSGMQYLVEHYSAEFPTIASLNGLFVAIAISVGPLFFHCAYHRTTGPKSHIWAALAIFLVTVPGFKAAEFGFPKDDPMEQAAANLDVAHTWKHLVVHLTIAFFQCLASWHVPWNPAKAFTPASDALSTKPTTPTRVRLSTDEACSPKRGAAAAGWGKTKAA